MVFDGEKNKAHWLLLSLVVLTTLPRLTPPPPSSPSPLSPPSPLSLSSSLQQKDPLNDGVQGYLKFSVSIVGPNDRLVVHKDNEEEGGGGGKVEGKDLGSLVLMPPTIKVGCCRSNSFAAPYSSYFSASDLLVLVASVPRF